MDIDSMKNIVVLKNLPSNMIDEAFVVLKDNVKIHKKELIENKRQIGEEEKVKSKDYIIKEAELIVSEYISRVEKKSYENIGNNKVLKEKYKRMKTIAIFFGLFSIFSIISILFR